MNILYFYVADDFIDYNCDVADGRGCEGQLCDKIYAGAYDYSTLKAGMAIDVLYDKAWEPQFLQ